MLLAIAAGAGAALALAEPVADYSGEVSDLARPKLTTITEFWEASKDERLRKTTHEVDLRFVALYFDPSWNLLWGDDFDKGGFMALTGAPMPFVSGQLVHLRGEVLPSDGFDPARLSVDIVRDQALPRPIELGNGAALNRPQQYDRKFVALEGYVDRTFLPDNRHLEIDLILADKKVTVRVLLDSGKPLPQLEETYARFEGVFVYTPTQGSNAAGLALWVASPSQIEIRDGMAESLFSHEATPIGSISEQFQASQTLIEGVVVAFEPGRQLVLRDHSGLIDLAIRQARNTRLGDRVQVVGEADLQGLAWTLRNAIYRPLAREGAELSVPEPETDASELRRAEQILGLRTVESETRQAADLNGVVTYVDPAQQFFYLNDSTGGVRVEVVEVPSHEIVFRSAAQAIGYTEAGGFAPALHADRITIAGTVPIPPAREITLEQAMTGIEDGQWVEMTGFVREVQRHEQTALLRIATTTGEFTALITDDMDTPFEEGSTIRLRGVCVVQPNRSGQVSEILLLVADPKLITVVDAALPDPFDAPSYTIERLSQYHAIPTANRLIQVHGVVLHHVPGRFIILSQGDFALRALSRSSETLSPGDAIDLVGLPGRLGSRFVLREAEYRKAGTQAEPAPIVLSHDHRLDPRLDNRLVTLQGRLINISAQPQESRLTLQNGQYATEVVLAGSAKEDWLPDSLISARGVYNLEFDEYGHPSKYVALLRSPEDITVLKAPSWWSPRRALAAAAAFGVALAIGLAWVGMLRQQVISQTAVIRRQFEKEAMLEARNREIVAKASDFIFTVDTEGRFTSFNRAGETLTGYTAEEAAGRLVFDLLDRRASLLSRFALRSRPSKAEGRVLQNLLRRRDGSQIWVETSIRFLHEGSTIAGALCVMRDITARKSIEEELKRARDAAEANTQAKSSFLATMSHELRTPMNGVIGMANLLIDTPLQTEQREYAETIRDSAEALLSLLNDILDLSKAEAGKLTVSPEPFDLEELVDQVQSLMQTAADSKRLELAAEIEPQTPRKLVGDCGRLRQVLLNLIGNALKFTEQGRVRLSISLDRHAASDCILRFEIADTGIGISAEAQSQLFQPFVQADSSHSRRYGGTGLGLVICRQIVALFGGEIGVRSVPGQGSVFWFTAALAEQTAAAPASRSDRGADPAPKATGVWWHGSPLRILVAEDNVVNQRVTALQLKKLGLQADYAENGRQVLERIQTQDYDVILMDCQMPELDGYETTRILRQELQRASLYIVALTANAMESDRERCLDCGMDDYVSKPTRPETLLQALERRNPSSPSA